MISTFTLLGLLAATPAAPTTEPEASTAAGYARAWDVSALADLQSLWGGSMGWVQPGTTVPLSGGLPGTPLQGVRLEVGSSDQYIGFSLLGLQVARGGGTVDFTPDGGAPAVPMTVTRYALAAFQPRVRYQYWRLQAFAQAGLDFLMLLGQPTDGASPMRAYSLGVAGRAGLRGFVISGLFLELGYSARLGVAFGQVPFQHGLLAGVGYAF